MEHSDRELTCSSCGKSFVFSAGEQAYFAQHGYQEPRRCKPCRAQRKAQAAEAGSGGDGRRAPSRHGNGNGNGNNPQGSRAVGGPRGRTPGFRPAAADDPNGYRAPGFQNDGRPAYSIDYAGLPRDEDDDAPGPGNARDTSAERMGMRGGPTQAPGSPSHQGRAPRFDAPRGMNGRRRDRAGTDPDAYRSPAFAGSAPNDNRGEQGSRKARRASRMRHEATCSDCGVHAMVPFQPGPDRPAYCKPCYQTRKANGTAPIPPSAGASAGTHGAGPIAAPPPAPAAPINDAAGE